MRSTFNQNSSQKASFDKSGRPNTGRPANFPTAADIAVCHFSSQCRHAFGVVGKSIGQYSNSRGARGTGFWHDFSSEAVQALSRMHQSTWYPSGRLEFSGQYPTHRSSMLRSASPFRHPHGRNGRDGLYISVVIFRDGWQFILPLAIQGQHQVSPTRGQSKVSSPM